MNLPGVNTYATVPHLTPTNYALYGLHFANQWILNPTPTVTFATGISGRMLPDVSLNADLNTGYLVYAPSFCPPGATGCPVLQNYFGGTKG